MLVKIMMIIMLKGNHNYDDQDYDMMIKIMMVMLVKIMIINDDKR